MFYWDPKPEAFTIPYLKWPVLWYGILFAFGFAVGFRIFLSLLVRYFRERTPKENGIHLRQKALALTDRLVLYMVVATLVGARLGHFLFYERPSLYLQHPLEIFQVWKGGLASHGAVLGILFALALFRYKIHKSAPDLSWVRLLDFVAIPAAFIGVCIRLGNFINQEILGTPTSLPWGVVFGHPTDHSLSVPRHPVQLYEALFYLAVFLLLWRLSFRPRYLLQQGKLIGLFLILVFGFRFCIEFLKLEQSHLLSTSLTMGQILSLPVIFLGCWFLSKKFHCY